MEVCIESPLGLMTLCFEDDELISALWRDDESESSLRRAQKLLNKPLAKDASISRNKLSRGQQAIVNKVKDFFKHGRWSCHVVSGVGGGQLKGTPFQKQVWNELTRIPFAETRSYGDIAKAIRKPRSARAVGMACAKNPLPIIVPCHRVVGHSGKLTGFSAGLWRKQWLLDFESRIRTGQSPQL